MLDRIREKLYEFNVIMPLKPAQHCDGSVCWELEWYSPAGEDCIWVIDGATEQEFAHDLRMYSNDFSELVHDAVCIEQILVDISDAIYEMVFDVKTIGEICGGGRRMKQFIIKIECDGNIDVTEMENLIANMLDNEIACTECTYDVTEI